jgi:hypothetical protein
MIVKQLLKVQFSDEVEKSKNQIEEVDTADKTKLYLQLDNMIEYLTVYR